VNSNEEPFRFAAERASRRSVSISLSKLAGDAILLGGPPEVAHIGLPWCVTVPEVIGRYARLGQALACQLGYARPEGDADMQPGPGWCCGLATRTSFRPARRPRRC
jgi:hypothetical protein